MRHLHGVARLAIAIGLLAGCGDDAGPPDAGPPPTDQCLNTTDIPIARMTQSGDAGITGDNDAGILSLGDYYANCATSDCLVEVLSEDLDAIDACMRTCTGTTPASGLTAGCRRCYEELVVCAGSSCANFCIADPGSAACTNCYTEMCAPPARLCTGIELL